MNDNSVRILSLLIVLFPLCGAILTALLGSQMKRAVINLIGTGSILFSFVVAITIFFMMLGAPSDHRSVTVVLWQLLNFGQGNLAVNVSVTVDQLSCIMALVITGVGFLIHVYSVGYMEDDPGIARFFSYMNFFVFSMLVLVLAANFLLLIIGWAFVALSSYLLIGFWYERPSAVLAARKAFITQVVGDIALVIAAFMIFINVKSSSGRVLNTLDLPTIFAHATSLGRGSVLITIICILIALGAFAKSAQFPFHTWLPDAMEGPTPVSALIHAATMVTAGVYLIARFHPLFTLSPVAEGMVACVGMGTALMAGIIALSQYDIKRVIAYSTMSQIGLMIYAVGIGAFAAGMFHLVTHAIFKALLFMAAGNVIHALHGEQDIRLMGGMSRKLRRTELCFLSGSFALAGIPFFAGWFSKENLLGLGLANGPWGAPWILYLVGLAINVLTGLYAFRLWGLVFRGEPATARPFASHEAPRVMLIPVAILAVLSAIVGFFLWWPFPGGWNAFSTFLSPVFASSGAGTLTTVPVGIAWGGLIVGTLASVLGVGIALRLWYKRQPEAHVVASKIPRFVTQLSIHAFYLDGIYDVFFVRPAISIARWFRRTVEPEIMDGWIRDIGMTVSDLSLTIRSYQTGLIRDYIAYIFMGAMVFALVAVWVVVK